VLWAFGAALILELVFYFSMGRRGLWSSGRLLASAFPPYLIYSLGGSGFRLESLLTLAAASAVTCLWLPLTRKWPVADVFFFAFVAAIQISGLPKQIFSEPAPGIPASVLGQLLWFRLALTSILLHRATDRVGFGFLPKSEEWRTGARWYLIGMPLLIVLMYALDAARFRLVPGIWWKAPLTFLGILWVVALGEEVLFRGVMLEHLRGAWGTVPALLASSVLFGAAHLWYGRGFPNWKMVALASVAGVFYGQAYLSARGVRAAMVTHAMVVTTWRSLFTG
jgi:membrane protease YdiL (CAAX protease family)